MPGQNGNYSRMSGNRRQERPKLPFFSTKPPKADWKLIKADYEGGCKNAFALLEKILPNESIWASYDDEEGTWSVFYRVARSRDGDAVGIICGRSTSYLKALCIVAHWAGSLTLETMFPQEDEREPGW